MKRYLIILSIFIFGCDTQIFPELPETEPLVAIDAWLYHKPEKQTIFITTTNTYFDDSDPDGISNANVRIVNVEDPDEVYLFTEEIKPGRYSWMPASSTDTFGILGESYFLEMVINEVAYASVASINRVPTIDSLTWRFSEGDAFSPDSYFANFWAKDFDGPGDTYWIKSWKNGELLSKPSEINVAFDAAFSSASGSDGLIFIQPIRENINPFDFDEDDLLINPFEIGDSIFVEINSISNEAFFYLVTVQEQISREGGFGELFAVPLANAQSNIFSENTDEKVVGFFNISASNSLGKVFREEDIRF
jgi:hypothetical protein